MSVKTIASVAVENSTFSFDKAYDYLVDSVDCDTLKAGCRVLVPFGEEISAVRVLLYMFLIVK